ncbi:hypothetical protein ODJ79_36155 [Actinoplanes sp. KI2]|uniref:hypothetical protein n=1 Tax=Actinoplanes sp. KI2 TaxID=2983315 RepID=UPI0021D6022C|nr:hypothetical protein [Actinoplanes sp. KI2]MCU7729179.1 hypothetical protein [Actinoplanes sp. KI2]
MDASDLPNTAEWPRISDYWPDAPHRMSPQADYYPDTDNRATAAPPAYPQDPQPQRLISPPPPPARKGLRLLLGALATMVFLGGSVVVLTRLVQRDTATPVAGAPQPSAAASEPAPSPPVSIAPAPASASATATGSAAPSTGTTAPPATLPFTSGTFELASDVAVINVTVAAIGTDPVRVSTPAGSGLKTRLTRDGSSMQLTAQAVDKNGSGRLDVRLNSKVTWSVRMTGGAREENFALAKGWIRRIDLIGGVARISMALPTPDETLPIRMVGGVNTWRITTPVRVPVKALLRDGGGRVILNGDETDGIDRNTTLRAGGGDNDSGGLTIDAVSGLGTLIVAPAAGTG